LLGLGELGAAAAIKLIDNSSNVCGWRRTSKSISIIECYTGSDGLKSIFAKTDITISILVFTPETAHKKTDWN